MWAEVLREQDFRFFCAVLKIRTVNLLSFPLNVLPLLRLKTLVIIEYG